MVVRKSPIEIAVEPCDVTAEKFQGLLGHQRCHPVSAVDHDMEALGVDVAEALLDIGQIVWNDGVLRQPSDPRHKRTGLHHRSKRLDLLSMNRVFSDADLKSIVFGCIVTPGDHNASVNRELKQRKIHKRRGTNTDIHDVQSTGKESL